jgi:hypothetical protein
MFHGDCFALYNFVDREVPGPDKGLRGFPCLTTPGSNTVGDGAMRSQQCGQNKPLFPAGIVDATSNTEDNHSSVHYPN